MRLYLIRHAQAGDRLIGSSDLYRPLSPKGHRRAKQLAKMLQDRGITRILSSPATRCVQTVEPLADGLGVEVEEQPDLWEGSEVSHALALLELRPEPAIVACSHGDLIPELIESLAASGTAVAGRGCEKGSIWVLDHDGRRWTRARYVSRVETTLPAG
jgi:8-oxo-dGTP diphosphatase